MEKAENFLNKYPFLVILTLSVPAIWALFVPGFFGASDDLHIAWLYEMDQVIKMGQFPPRFVPDLSFGFGYPLFNFVFPLPFYVGELFHLAGLSFVDSIKAVFLLSIPLSAFFIYKLLKEFTTPLLALAGAVLYIFTPYRSTDIYVRGAIGEALAFVFMPLVALSIVKLTKKGGVRWIGILALASAALITSHNIMAYMFFPFIGLLGVIQILQQTPPRLPLCLKICTGLLLGLLVASYFWLPAIVESSLMKYDTVFNFVDHFPTIKQLITPYFGYGASVPGPYDGMSFFIGAINLILVVIAFGALIFWQKLPRGQIALVIWSLAMVLVAVFLMNYRSAVLWSNLPLLPYFQFPWRFLSLTTFATPLLIVVLSRGKWSNLLGLAIILAAVAFNFSYFKPHDFLGRTDEYYLKRYIPSPVASDDYLKTGEEYLRLPKNTTERPDRIYPRVQANRGEITNISLTNGLAATFDIESREGTFVTYYKYLFPGWKVAVDGQRVDLHPAQPFGQFLFKVDSGKHNVKVWFGETPFRMIFDLTSLLALGIAATMVLRRRTDAQ